jgi:hypothetical protein
MLFEVLIFKRFLVNFVKNPENHIKEITCSAPVRDVQDSTYKFY